MSCWLPSNSTCQARRQPSTTGTSGDWSNNGCWWRCKGTDGGGDPTKRQAHITFTTGSLLSNDALIHQWTNDRLDATLGRHTNLNRSGTTVGIQGNMAIVQNMSGIIATEVGKGLGFAMQNATKASTRDRQTVGLTMRPSPTPKTKWPPC